MDIQTNSKINFSSHRVTVAWRQSLMKRHENTRLCISDIIDPIDSKLHTYHKTPGLMTSTQKSWLKMTAPPGGNRKCLVFCMSYIWMYSSSPTARSHVKPYQMGLKTLIMKAYDYCDFSSNAILVAWRQSSSTRRDTRNYYNFGVGASTSLKPQARARPIRAQARARPIRAQARALPIRAQARARPIRAQARARPIRAQARARPIRAQARARPIRNQQFLIFILLLRRCAHLVPFIKSPHLVPFIKSPHLFQISNQPFPFKESFVC